MGEKVVKINDSEHFELLRFAVLPSRLAYEGLVKVSEGRKERILIDFIGNDFRRSTDGVECWMRSVSEIQPLSHQPYASLNKS